MRAETGVEAQLQRDLLDQVGRRFSRREPRERMLQYVRGLSTVAARKNGWTLSALAGATSPDAMQRLLRTAVWDVDGVRDDVRAHVIPKLGQAEPLWILDEAAFPKRGSASVGVGQQYMRNERRLENCQVGIFMVYATAQGQALVDRELYLPPAWTESRTRRNAAGIPDSVIFASKPALGQRMLQRAYDAGVLTGWVSADKTYGAAPALRRWLLDRRIPSVLATNNDHPIARTERHWAPADAVVEGVLANLIPTVDGWRTAPIQAGLHSGELFDWAAVEQGHADLPAGWARWLLMRRETEPSKGTHHRKTACYRCVGPAHTSVETLIHIASGRWRSELCFAGARQDFGLDQYQVRDWRGWHAHITLSMVAAALALP